MAQLRTDDRSVPEGRDLGGAVASHHRELIVEKNADLLLRTDGKVPHTTSKRTARFGQCVELAERWQWGRLQNGSY